MPVPLPVRLRRPKNFFEFQNGITYLSDGLKGVQRWDSLQGAPESGGVVGPEGAPHLNGNGKGGISGDLYARVRFVDRLGYVSNVSDASNLYVTGSLVSFSDLTNTVPIVVVGASTGLKTGDIVFISGAKGNTAANGSWVIKVIDSGHFSLNFSAGNGIYTGGATVTAGVAELVYSDLPVPTDPKVVRRQILRTKAGDSNVYYIDIDTENLTALALASTNTDDELTVSLAVPMIGIDGEDNAIIKYGLPPDDKAVLVSHLGRMYAWASVIYQDGNAAAVNGSTRVDGIGTDWTFEMKNRVFYSKGSLDYYQILEVDEALQNLTLDKPYTGPTDPYLQYGIQPSAERLNVAFYSEAGLPEAWPPTNAFPIPFDPEAGEETAAMSFSSFMFFFYEYRTWRMTTQLDPARDGSVFRTHSRGCVNQRCWVIVDGTAFSMDRGGLYSMTVSGMDPVSTNIIDLFSGFSPYSINWNARRHFHCQHSPQEEIVRWFVALAGDDVPHHAIAYCYRTGAISIESYSRPVGSSCLGVLDGRPQTYLGLDAARVVASYTGTLDGPTIGTGTLRSKPSRAGHTWIEDDSAVFPAGRLIQQSLIGCPIVICEGRGRGQVRTITNIVDNRITVLRPWTERPNQNSVYQIGGIPWLWRSGWIRYPESDNEKPFNVEVIWQRTELPSTMSLRIFHDQATDPENWAQDRIARKNDSVGTKRGEPDIQILTDDKLGLVRQAIPQQRETTARGRRHISVELSGVTNGDVISVSQLTLEGVSAS